MNGQKKRGRTSSSDDTTRERTWDTDEKTKKAKEMSRTEFVGFFFICPHIEFTTSVIVALGNPPEFTTCVLKTVEGIH